MDRHLRLRLHVRRHGLPEEHILFPVPLTNDPTIADLLELVNNDIPLVDGDGEWDLNDYVVELHQIPSGAAFECLHFRPVAGLLEKDDEVFIRPLLTKDLKKRRLGGRHQILAGGEHIFDGVPFGRSRLRIPSGRPPVTMAPRKRRRLLERQEYDAEGAQDDLDQELPDDDYIDPQAQQEGVQGHHRLLTQHGDGALRPPRSVRFSSGSGSASGEGSDDDIPDAEEEDEDDGPDADEQEEDNGSHDGEDDMVDSQELADEAADLQRDLSEDAQDLPRTRTRTRTKTRTKRTSSAAPVAARDQEPSCHSNANDLGSLEDDRDAAPKYNLSDTALLDKIIAVKHAFPDSPHHVCVKLLQKYNMDVSTVWKTLAKTLKPRYELGETMVFATQLEMPREIQLVSSPARSPVEELGDISRIDNDEEAEASSSSEEECGSDASDDSSEDKDDKATPVPPADSDSVSDGDSNNAHNSPSEHVSAQPNPSRDEADHGGSSSGSNYGESESENRPTNVSKVRVGRASILRDSSSSDDSSSEDSSSEDSSSDDSSSDDNSSNENEEENRSGKSTSARSQSKQTKTHPSLEPRPKSPKVTSPDSSDAIESSSEEDAPIAKHTRRRGRKIVNSSPVSSMRSAKPKTPTKAATSERVSDDSSSVSGSESSSESSSDSSSESESEDETVAPSQQISPPAKTVLVPPGQGMTKTQRRNQRRRLSRQFKQDATQTPDKSQQNQDTVIKETDLEAKKIALLQALASRPSAQEESTEQAVEDVQMADQAQDAWKKKITYRAVECVQEGVELSQPPFPFVQRWDPQQRWDDQPNQRHGKRKARADSQFYCEPNSHSAKKRRFQPNLEGYSYQEDTITSLANQGDDIVLDYDDTSFHPDEDAMTNGYVGLASRAADEQAVDDLPPLPEDMASLAQLQLTDIKLDMVIAWKQLLCSEATQWQPLVSEYMTASVTEIHKDGSDLQVQLATRDRNVGRTQRKYDDDGNRIYGKFEVPDMDVDEEVDDEDPDEEVDDEDHGFRDLSFSEMIDPRIVLQAPEANGAHASGEEATEDDPSNGDEPGSAAPQLPELGFEVADSQPKQGGHDKESSNGRTPSLEQSGTLDNDQGAEQEPGTAHAMDKYATEMDVAVEDSFIPDTVHDEPNSTFDGVSISEERRSEISELINQGGFRQEVRSSIDQSGFARFDQQMSPSRQLAEEYATSVLLSNRASSTSSSSEAPSEYDAKVPVKGNVSQRVLYHSAPSPQSPSGHYVHTPSHKSVSQIAVDAEGDTFHSAPQTPSPAPMRSDAVNGDESTRVTTPIGQHSTGEVEYPKLTIASQTTQASGSDFSGCRQPDPNLITHSDDLGASRGGDDSSNIGGFDEDWEMGNASALNKAEWNRAPGDTSEWNHVTREETPTQQTYNDDLLNSANEAGTPLKAGNAKDVPRSPPSPAVSTTSSSSLPSIGFLCSQPAETRFKELSPMVKSEQARSKDAAAEKSLPDTPPRQTQRVLTGSSPAPQPSASPGPHSTPGMGNGSIVKSSFIPAAGNAAAAFSPSPGLLSSPHKRKASTEGSIRSMGAKLEHSISPPPLSRLQQNQASPSLVDNDDRQSPIVSRRINGTNAKGKASAFSIPKGSQVVSLLSSSPEPEAEYEAEAEADEEEPDDDEEADGSFSEMYPDDDVDSDYIGDGQSKSKKPTRYQIPRHGAKRGVSVPVAERKEKTVSMSPGVNWVTGSQGPSRKASGRFGGRSSSGAAF